MSSAASIFASLRFLATKFPKSLQSTRTLDPTTLKLINPSFFLFFKPISFQNITSSKSPPPISASSSSSSPSSAMSLQPIEELPPKLQEIVKLFQSVQEPKAKYEQLLFYGKNLKPLEPHFKTRANKVEGCVSQVWVRAYLDTNKNVVFEADSDSVLTKGLAALLVQGLSGRPVDEVLRVSPDFVVLLGLQQSLTPSRNNGFLNMLKLMQKKAIELYVEAEKGSESVHVTKTDEESDGGSSNEVGHGEIEKEKENENLVPDGGTQDSPVGLNSDESLGSRGIRIREILDRELNPMELEVEDVSYQHAGHAGVRGSDGETHFNVKVVSKEFEGKSLVKRHRLIYGLLQDELQCGLHALSIVAKTPAEMSGR